MMIGTARAAEDLGYRVFVVSDACSAAKPDARTASIASLGLLAEITSTDDLIAVLVARPADITRQMEPRDRCAAWRTPAEWRP